MKSRDFAFWLQGFFELGGGEAGLNATQVAVIKQHLGLVFQHDTDIAAAPHPPIPATNTPIFPRYITPGTAGEPIGGPYTVIC